MFKEMSAREQSRVSCNMCRPLGLDGNRYDYVKGCAPRIETVSNERRSSRTLCSNFKTRNYLIVPDVLPCFDSSMLSYAVAPLYAAILDVELSMRCLVLT